MKIVMLFSPSAAKLQNKYSTPRHKANIRHGGFTKIKNNNFNLPLCLFWFLGVFVFEDFFAKKPRLYM
jgi:hypothetical protein